jgi:hypothetical protein
MAGLFGAVIAPLRRDAPDVARKAAAAMQVLDRQALLIIECDHVMAGVVMPRAGTGGACIDLPNEARAIVAGYPVLRDDADTLPAFMARLLTHVQHSNADAGALLSRLDGPFAIAIVDERSGQVHLFNDRFGGVPIYYHAAAGALHWGSETKAITSQLPADLPFDVDAMRHFLAKGYVPPDRTYHRGVLQLPACTMLTVDLRDAGFRLQPWRDVVTVPANGHAKIGICEAVPVFLDLARKALARRLRPINGNRVCVTLSGGLDSRFVLALACEAKVDLRAVTYGQRDADEVGIAKQVARLAGVAHEVIAIDRTNWLDGRDLAVWMSDGMMDLTHAHIIHTAPALRDAALVLDGLFGDVVLGRGAITLDASLPEADNRYLRMNRFTYFGPRIEANFTPVATPLIDADLVAFMDSLPPALTADGRLYREAAHALHPRLHADVAWHKTGRPPYPYAPTGRGDPIRKARKRLLQGLSWIGLPVGQRYFTMDYQRWCRDADFMQLMRMLVYGPDSQLRLHMELPEYRTIFSVVPNRHHVVLPTRLLTLEVWLRQHVAGKALSWAEMGHQGQA